MYQGPTPAELEFFKYKALIMKVIEKKATADEFQYLLDYLTPDKLRLRDAQGQNLLYWVIFAADVNAPHLFIEIWKKYQASLTLDDFRPLEANKGRQQSPLYLLASMAKVNNFFQVVWNRFKPSFKVNDLSDYVKSFDGNVTTVLGFIADAAMVKPQLLSEIFECFHLVLTQSMLYSRHYYIASSQKSPIHSIIEATVTGKLDPRILRFCGSQIIYREEDLDDLPEAYQMSSGSMKNIVKNITPAGEIEAIQLEKLIEKKMAFLKALRAVKNNPAMNAVNLILLAREATKAGFYAAFPTLARIFNNVIETRWSLDAAREIPKEYCSIDKFQISVCRYYENQLKYDRTDEISTRFLTIALESALKIEDIATRNRIIQRFAHVFINKVLLAPNQPGPMPDNLLALMNSKTPVEWCVMKVKARRLELMESAVTPPLPAVTAPAIAAKPLPHVATPAAMANPGASVAKSLPSAKPMPPLVMPTAMAKPIPPVLKPTVVGKPTAKSAPVATIKPATQPVPRQEAEAIVSLFALSLAKPAAVTSASSGEIAKQQAKRAKK
ncbi:MAG: hypothetical protein AB7I18_04110 [Candidatus Berkiella sp.]